MWSDSGVELYWVVGRVEVGRVWSRLGMAVGFTLRMQMGENDRKSERGSSVYVYGCRWMDRGGKFRVQI